MCLIVTKNLPNMTTQAFKPSRLKESKMGIDEKVDPAVTSIPVKSEQNDVQWKGKPTQISTQLDIYIDSFRNANFKDTKCPIVRLYICGLFMKLMWSELTPELNTGAGFEPSVQTIYTLEGKRRAWTSQTKGPSFFFFLIWNSCALVILHIKTASWLCDWVGLTRHDSVIASSNAGLSLSRGYMS